MAIGDDENKTGKENSSIEWSDPIVVKFDLPTSSSETPESEKSPMIIPINVPHVTWNENTKSNRPISFTR